MFGITTSRDFLAKLEADFADYEKDPGSARLALNCAMTAYHLYEWVWGDWLKADRKTRALLGVQNQDSFRDWLFEACPWLAWMQELTNGTKHFGAHPSFQALKVSRALDRGLWDGSIPYTTDNHVFLFIDNGPEAADHRWMPVGQLLHAVVGFWRIFFEKHAPPPSLSRV